MKLLIVFLIVCGFCLCNAQTVNIDSLCNERGHIIEHGVVTLVGYENQYIDLENSTLIIKNDPNYISGYCIRCGKYVTQPVQAMPDTVIIWRKDIK